MKITFDKIVALGNDFIIIDNRNNKINIDSEIIKKIAPRRTGIGADGVLILERSETYDFSMVYFNQDGSRASLCGNGARSLILYAHNHGIGKEKVKFISDASVHEGMVVNGIPIVSMPGTKAYYGKIDNFYFLNTGVPHAVVITENLDFDIDKLAKPIRFHPKVMPDGTNVDFIKISNEIYARVYERGVEGETLSCGTGAIAIAHIANLILKKPYPIKINFKGGTLTVDKDKDNNTWLSGNAKLVYTGFINI